MRRIDIINSVNLIKEALQNSELNELFQSKENPPLALILEHFKLFWEYAAKFSEHELSILAVFDIAYLMDLSLWGYIFEPNNRSQYLMDDPKNSINYFLTHVPKYITLLRQDNIEYTNHDETAPIDGGHNKKELLTVILPEKSDEMSKPERLINILQAINNLYDAFSIIHKADYEDLTIAAIDSGSDKSFDFLGAAKLIQEIKELIINLWDRIVFHKQRKLSEGLDLITKSLPILETIVKLQKNKTIDPEQAELLKRTIINSAEKFINSGAIIPEINNHSYNNPRLLLAAEPKLLNPSQQYSHSKDEEKNTADILKSPTTNLSNEEIKKLKEMLNIAEKKI